MTVVEYPFMLSKSVLSKKEEVIFMNIITALHSKDIMNKALELSKEDVDKEVIEPVIEQLKKETENEQ
jgi:hypothetical protein